VGKSNKNIKSLPSHLVLRRCNILVKLKATGQDNVMTSQTMEKMETRFYYIFSKCYLL